MDGSTSAFALVLLATFISKVVDFGKFVRAKDTNGVLTQLITWGAGVLGVCLFAQTDFATGVSLEGVSLATAGWGTLVFAGLMSTSLLSKVYDFQKSFDNTQTSATPSLVPGTGVVNTATGHANPSGPGTAGRGTFSP